MRAILSHCLAGVLVSAGALAGQHDTSAQQPGTPAPALPTTTQRTTIMDKDRIQICPENRWYWQYKGQPLLLLGGSDEDNLFNHPNLWFNLDKLQQIGGNYVRMTLSSRDQHNVWPYQLIDGKYDLTRFNPDWWDRLANCIRQAHQRDIIVQIEFFATFDFYRDNWQRNPFNPTLNTNYTTTQTTLLPKWDHHPARQFQPFFASVPELNNDLVLLNYQQAFVRKVLDVTLDLPNVLYCLDNETATPPQWAWYWAEFIRQELARRRQQIYLTEMWDDHDITGGRHRHTYDRPDLFTFVDISQNNWQSGPTHYDHLMTVRRYLAQRSAGPCPMNNVKVYGRTPGGLDVALNLDRWWQNIFAGCASTRFHRPTAKGSGLGLNHTAQAAVKAARIFTDAFDIFSCQPRADLIEKAQPDQVYCLADPPQVYAVYFAKGGQATLRITGTGPWQVRWFDPRKGQFNSPQQLKPDNERVELTAPDTQPWLALIDHPDG